MFPPPRGSLGRKGKKLWLSSWTWSLCEISYYWSCKFNPYHYCVKWKSFYLILIWMFSGWRCTHLPHSGPSFPPWYFTGRRVTFNTCIWFYFHGSVCVRASRASSGRAVKWILRGAPWAFRRVFWEVWQSGFKALIKLRAPKLCMWINKWTNKQTNRVGWDWGTNLDSAILRGK